MEIIAVLFVLLIVGGGVVAAGVFFFKNTTTYSLAEYERIAVFRDTGEFVGIRGPGEIRIWPSILFIKGEQVRDVHGNTVTNPDAPGSRFDLREVTEELDRQRCTTADSVTVDILPAIIFKVSDPQKLVLNIQDHRVALHSAVSSTLRAVVGRMTLTDVVTGRDTIATQMTAGLSAQADRWGVSIISVEIQEIQRDPTIVQAMNERRAAEERAERDRQDLVVAAEARRQGAVADNEAAIARAEAEKQTTIAQAEAYKQAVIARAEGERDAEMLKAEGVAALYKTLIELGDGAEIALRYEQIQALRTLSESSNSKLVIVPANMAAVNNVAQLPFIEGVIPAPPAPASAPPTTET